MTTTSSHGQGAVRNPAQDGRLKDNKAATVGKSTAAASAQRSQGQGAAKNPANDGRTEAKR